jgi:branched-chain amino acid aminotransferase
MGRFVSWNGEIVREEEARVSVFDAGFLYGDGIYETMRAYGGRAFALHRHLERLDRSAGRVDLELPGVSTLRHAVESVLEANDAKQAIVRITVTRGRLAKRLDLSSASSPSILVTTDPIEPDADRKRRLGVRVVYSNFLRLSEDPLAGVKSTNYQISLFARNEAREANALEVLIPNESGEIVEAAAANVFLVENGGLVTPPLRSGILGGITRAVVLELAERRDLAVRESTLSRERVEAAEELFLSGTTIQVTPIVRIEERAIAGGRPGPITLALLDDYLAAVEEDTGESAEPAHLRETDRIRHPREPDT